MTISLITIMQIQDSAGPSRGLPEGPGHPTGMNSHVHPLIGRSREQAALEFALDGPGTRVVALVGSRGSGKTALLAAALQGRQSLHFQVADLPPGDLIADLRALAEAVLGQVPSSRRPGVLPLGPGRGEWLSLLKGIGDHVEESDEPFVLALDGFEALTGAHRRIEEELLEVVESAATRSVPLRLVLTARRAEALGAFAREEVAAWGQPTTLTLGALPYRDAGWDRLELTPRDAFLRWAILGDHPDHVRPGYPGESLGAEVVRRVLDPRGDLFDAPLRRLEAGFRRPARYAGVLRALAAGTLDWSGILRSARGIDSGAQLAPYLKSLEEEGLVRVALPLDAGPRSRSRRYAPADPFLGFWFGWVLPYRSLLPSLGGEAVWRDFIRPGLEPHLQHWMEEAARRWIAEHAEEGLGAPAREVGALWGGEADFPVAGRLANGQVCYGLVEWGASTDHLPREMERRMRETRYGIGRQARGALYFLAEKPGPWIRRSVARESFSRVVGLDELMGTRPPWQADSGA